MCGTFESPPNLVFVHSSGLEKIKLMFDYCRETRLLSILEPVHMISQVWYRGLINARKISGPFKAGLQDMAQAKRDGMDFPITARSTIE